MTTPKPTPETLLLATKAALHLRNRLGEPRFASLFDSLRFTNEQSECLAALAEVGAYYAEYRAKLAAAGERGGRPRDRKPSATALAWRKRRAEKKEKIV